MNSHIIQIPVYDNNMQSWSYPKNIQDNINNIPKNELNRWNKTTIKDYIRNELRNAQKNGFDDLLRCTLCGSKLKTSQRSDGDIEHFAPIKKYPEFAYEIDNLSLACTRCNQPLKNDYATIIDNPYSTNYSDNTFNLIHPIYDKNSDHITAELNKNNYVVFFWPVVGSDKGKNSIELFELNTNEDRQRDRFDEYISLKARSNGDVLDQLLVKTRDYNHPSI